jgi:hypothetical protein
LRQLGHSPIVHFSPFADFPLRSYNAFFGELVPSKPSQVVLSSSCLGFVLEQMAVRSDDESCYSGLGYKLCKIRTRGRDSPELVRNAFKPSVCFLSIRMAAMKWQGTQT